ncbi:MAG: hypothetical protein ACYDIE_04985 [Candidatus Krumholzibacteriia bacterium]
MRRVKNILIFALALAGTLALLDGYLQTAEIQTPMETRIDPLLGPTYIPHKRITRFNEGLFIGSANAYGYMGPAVPPRRRGAEHRVLLLGDSFVLGHTVLPRHYFGRFLEQRLSKVTGEQFHALNFGKADFNFWNMYQYYRDFAGLYDHDIALFFVGPGDLVPDRQVASDLYPAVTLQGDSLVIDRSFRGRRTYRFYKTIEPVFTNSAVLRLIFNSYKMVRRHELADVVLDKFAPRRAAVADETAPDAPPPTAELPPTSRAILRELARDPRNVLVIQRSLAPELRDAVRAAGLPMIDLGAFLDSLSAAGEDPYYWPITRRRGHWNHAAHPVIGRFLADQLLAAGLVKPDSALADRQRRAVGDDPR